jgi:hypothetical protein
VVSIDPDPDWDFINSMSRKYLGQETYPFGKPDDEWLILVVRPEYTTEMG